MTLTRRSCTDALFARTPLSRAQFAEDHYFPPAMLAAQADARAEGLIPDVRAWTPARSLASMDEGGIATAIVSTSSGAELRKSLDAAGMRKLARTCNEYAAAHGDRPQGPLSASSPSCRCPMSRARSRRSNSPSIS